MNRPLPWLRTRFIVTMTALIATIIALFTGHISGEQFTWIVGGIISAFKIHDVVSDKINRG